MRKSIYAIRNNVNGKTYVGQTSNLKKRFTQHKWNAETEFLDRPLYKDMLEYGDVNFTYLVLETVEGTAKEINAKEQEFIKSIPTELRYNTIVEGEYSHKGLAESKRPRAIIGHSLTDGSVIEFESAYEAVKALTDHHNVGFLVMHLNGKRPSAYGYKWTYKN